jgi:hypothetical protein
MFISGMNPYLKLGYEFRYQVVHTTGNLHFHDYRVRRIDPARRNARSASPRSSPPCARCSRSPSLRWRCDRCCCFIARMPSRGAWLPRRIRARDGTRPRWTRSQRRMCRLHPTSLFYGACQQSRCRRSDQVRFDGRGRYWTYVAVHGVCTRSAGRPRQTAAQK